VLPNATKTEVVTTFNLRQWRHVFQERALNPAAQWQIREIMQSLLTEFKIHLPAVFEDQFQYLIQHTATNF
jgi:thymidylate synthase (FAD)